VPKKKRDGPNSTILGAAGEHYVMYQLLRRNMIAALAPAGVPNADIVVTDKLGDRLCAVQVKVRRDIGSDGGWHMGQKHEALTSPNLFYCFVDFGRSVTDQPKTWVLPSAIVAKSLDDIHKDWLRTLGAKGQQRNDSNFRRFMPEYRPLSDYKMGWLDLYFENWSSLEVASKTVTE
jgi:hypothetical protein